MCLDPENNRDSETWKDLEKYLVKYVTCPVCASVKYVFPLYYNDLKWCKEQTVQ